MNISAPRLRACQPAPGPTPIMRLLTHDVSCEKIPFQRPRVPRTLWGGVEGRTQERERERERERETERERERVRERERERDSFHTSRVLCSVPWVVEVNICIQHSTFNWTLRDCGL